MLDSAESWLKSHAERPLPIFRQSRDFFERQQEIPSVNVSRLAKACTYDPGLSLTLLRQAGKSQRANIQSVPHAIRLLGVPQTLHLVANLPTVEESLQPAGRYFLDVTAARAFHCNQQVLNIATLNKENATEDLSTAATLSQLADYLITCYQPEQEKQIFSLVKSKQLSYEQATTEVLGFVRSDITTAACQLWSLPALIAYSAQEPVCNKSRLIANMHQLCEAVELQGWFGTATDTIVHSIGEDVDRSAALITTRLHKTTVRCSREIHRSYPLAIVPARKLPLILPRTVQKQKNSNKVTPLSPRASSKIQLEAAIKKLRAGQLHSYPEIMSSTLTAMNRALGLTRTFFAVLSHDRKKLTIKFIIAGSESERLNRQSLLLKDERLLTAMLKKPGALLVNAGNADRYLPLVSVRFRSLLTSDNFLVYSVFLKDKPLGLFYADLCNQPIADETCYQYFKILCRESSQAVTRLASHVETTNAVNQ